MAEFKGIMNFLRKRPGAGGDKKDVSLNLDTPLWADKVLLSMYEKSPMLFGDEGKRMEKLKKMVEEKENRVDNNKDEGGLRPFVLDKAIEGFGKIFSNVKKPYGYSNEPLLKVLSRVPGAVLSDSPQWQNQINKVVGARDFLNRKGFMDESAADRFGGLGYFDKAGDNKYKIKTENTGIEGEPMNVLDLWPKDYYTPSEIAQTFVKEELDKGSTMKNNTPAWQKMNEKVMGHVSQPEFAGEGEDDRGYYNIVKGSDVWDYSLTPLEEQKMNDMKTGKGFDLSKLVEYLGRDMTSSFRESPEVQYETKVYIPNIKKQPRKKKVLRIPGGDVMNPDI